MQGGGKFLRAETALAALALGALAASRLPWPRARRAALAALALAAAGAAWTAARPALTPPRDSPAVERASAPEGARNLVVIVLDTVGAKHLAPYGYARETTPRLDRFAREQATLWRQARSVTSWTLPAHGSLFTGMEPARHGTTHLRVELPEGHPMREFPALPLRRDVPTLAGILAEQGWETGAVIGNSPFVSRRFGMDRGFEHFDDRDGAHLPPRFALVQFLGLHPGVGYLAYRRAETITDLALDWLDRGRERPFFLFLNYMDAHYPYVPPAPFHRAFDEPAPRDPLHFEFETFALLYDRELLYLDRHVGRLLDALERDGRLADTAIVVTSDHGEVFGEHGLYFHNLTLYENVTRVPLYVHRPGVPGGGTSDEPVTTVDLFGMSLDLAGLPPARRPPPPPPPDPPGATGWRWVGEWYRDEELAQKVEDPESLRRDLVAWVDGDRKAIVSSRDVVELYDLAADPWETRNLAAAASEAERAALVERARRWWEERPPLAEIPDGELDPETLQRLRALGYVD